MKSTNRMALFAFALVVTTLVGCGGGGGGDSTPSSPVPTVTTFPIYQSVVAVLNTSETRSFTLSGTVSQTAVGGSGSATFGGLKNATFESKAALAKLTVVTGTLTLPGQSAPLATTSTIYVDSNYQPLGSSSSDLYAVVVGPVTIPQTASVNSTGRLYGYDRYTNSTKLTKAGTATVEYALVQETPSTAQLKLITTNKSNSGTVEATDIEIYRISATGTVTRISEQMIIGIDSLTMTYGP